MKKWSLFFLLGAITLAGLINSADLPVRPSPSQIKKVDLAERNEREQAFKAVSAKLSDDIYKQQRAHSRYLKWENYQWPHLKRLIPGVIGSCTAPCLLGVYQCIDACSPSIAHKYCLPLAKTMERWQRDYWDNP